MGINFVNDSASIGTSEYYLASDSTTPTYQTDNGVYQLVVDLNNLAAGDQFRIKLYEKYDSGGTARLVEEWIFTNVQSKPLFISPSFILGEGWEWSVTKLAGTDRTIYWSIRSIT